MAEEEMELSEPAESDSDTMIEPRNIKRIPESALVKKPRLSYENGSEDDIEIVAPPNPDAPTINTFVPDDIDYQSIMNFTTVLQFAGNINDDQVKYLQAIAESYKRLNERAKAAEQKCSQIQEILGGNAAEPAPRTISPLEQLFLDMANVKKQEAEAAEEPKSFMIKKGDEEAIQEFQDREEASKATSISQISQPLSEEQLTKEEMDARRRARYNAVQQESSIEIKKQQESVRKAESLDKFWKNTGTANPHAK